MTKKRETTIVELRTCVDYGFDFVVFVYATSLVDDDQDQMMMNTYVDRHVMMMMVVAMKLEVEKPVVVIVAFDMDLRKFDNKPDRCRQPDEEDNMMNRNPVLVNDSSMINVHFA
jgi:hypothetical protein